MRNEGEWHSSKAHIENKPVKAGMVKEERDSPWSSVRHKRASPGAWFPLLCRAPVLGIPTVQDRLIQQMMLQVLTAIFDPMFSEHSYGFRPRRSAQGAVRAAQQHAQAGKDWVVDFDIANFLDRVIPDKLMGQVAERDEDKRLSKLIRAFLILLGHTHIFLRPSICGRYFEPVI